MYNSVNYHVMSQPITTIQILKIKTFLASQELPFSPQLLLPTKGLLFGLLILISSLVLPQSTSFTPKHKS